MPNTGGLYKYYEGLQPWGKGVAVIGMGAAIYLLYDTISKRIKEQRYLKDAKRTLDDVSDELKKLTSQGMRPSYSDSQYKIWADVAYTCYAGWGTCSGDTIFVNMKNDSDVLKLIEAFGVRTIPSGRFNPASDFRGTLPQVVRDELNIFEIQRLNNILASKGIKYKF